MPDNFWFSIAFILIIAPGLTCLIEVPIIKGFRVTANIKYIILVNLLTNYCLNIGAVFITFFLGEKAYLIWNIVFEALIIPISEAMLYKLISDRRCVHIVHVSYLANAISFGIGLIITNFL